MTRNLLHSLLATLSLVLGFVSTAQAVTITNTTVDVFDTSGPEFISGDGIPIDGFIQDSVAPGIVPVNTVSVAVKARDRDTGQPNFIVGNRYFVDAGFSSTNPAVTNLSFDYQFDPGTDGNTNYMLQLLLDFDPAFGATDFVNFTLPIFDADGIPDATVDSWSETDGFFTNPGAGAWNDDDVPYVVSNSTRLDFGFFSTVFGKTYDPNASGEYEIQLRALDSTGTIELASVNAFAVVGVPEPGSIALASLAGLFGTLGFRRRRRA